MHVRPLIVVAVFAGLASVAGAQPRDLPICRTSIEPAWNRVSGGDDLAAMDRVIATMNNCPELRTRASRERSAAAQRLRQAEEAEQRRQADAAAAAERRRQQERERQDALRRQREAEEAQRTADQQRRDTERRAEASAWTIAREGNTVATYNAYLSEYPNGLHAPEARRARDALNNVRVSLCNNSSAETVHAAIMYQAPGASNWSGAGWYELTRGQCRDLFTTATRRFYVRRAVSDQRIWEGASTQRFTYCDHQSEAFNFTWSSGAACPSNLQSAVYVQYVIPDGATTFRANVIDSPERIADEAAWATASRTNSIEAYASYLSRYPNGLHANEAREARQRLEPLEVTVCNDTGADVVIARVYRRPGETDWRYVGWTRITTGTCATVLETRNSYFYLRGERATGSGEWVGPEDSRRNQCVMYPGPYDFTLGTNASCPSGASSVAFREFNIDVSTRRYTWRLVP